MSNINEITLIAREIRELLKKYNHDSIINEEIGSYIYYIESTDMRAFAKTTYMTVNKNDCEYKHYSDDYQVVKLPIEENGNFNLYEFLNDARDELQEEQKTIEIELDIIIVNGKEYKRIEDN